MGGQQVTGPISPLPARIGDGPLQLILAGSAVGSLALGYRLFRRLEHVAKERGVIDQTTGY